MINRAVITGRLTADPELKVTASGISVATFTVAVNRSYINKQSNQRDADFIRCVAWKNSAETFCKYTSKGSLVGIDGEIQTRSYDDKYGNHVYVTEIRVDSFSFLETKGSSKNINNSSYDNSAYNDFNNSKDNAISTNESSSVYRDYSSSSNDQFNTGNNDTIDISEDDLPF